MLSSYNTEVNLDEIYNVSIDTRFVIPSYIYIKSYKGADNFTCTLKLKLS